MSKVKMKEANQYAKERKKETMRKSDMHITEKKERKIKENGGEEKK